MKSCTRWFLVLFILATALMSCGPSNHAIRPEKITPDQINTLHSHHGSVVLKVDGGWENAILGLQLMPNTAVMEALETAVEASRLFDKITTTDGKGDYCLLAFIYDIDQPLMGGTGTVTVEIAWSLADIQTETIIWRDSIETTHTAVTEAMISLRKKSNLAAEAATKENIQLALERISGLQL